MKFIEGQVRWGIVGCGDVCEVKSGPALQKVPDSSLVAVMRRDIEKAKDFASRHHVPKFYSNVDQLITDPQVNAVYIATPPDTHEAYALRAVEAGKPVYVEKPVAKTSTECARMIAASKRYEVPVTVAHYRRGLALFRRVRSLINDRAIGDARMIDLRLMQPPKPAVLPDASPNWRVMPDISGGGLLFDLGPHQLDIICWLFGRPLNVVGQSVNQGKGYQAGDVFALSAVFEGDVFFQGVWSFNSPPHACVDEVKIIGSKGSLSFPFFASVTDTRLKVQLPDGDDSEEFLFPEHIQQPMIEEVVAFFQGKSHNPCSLEDALVSLRMIEQTLPSPS